MSDTAKISKSIIPYHFYALYNWIVDNGFKPHVYIRNTQTTQFPSTLQTQEAVLFNIHPDAIGSLTVDDDGISFSARFNQKEFVVYSKLEDCLAIIAKEVNFVANFPFIPTLVKTPVQEEQPKPSEFDAIKQIVTALESDGVKVADIVNETKTTNQIPGRKVRHLTVVK